MRSITARTFGLAAPYWLRSSDRLHGWAFGLALLLSVALITGLSYELTALQKTFFDALEKRLERRRVKLDDLRTFPVYLTCSVCKRPTREAPAGLALGIRTRWRWVDGQNGPITVPGGRIISVTETADVCSGACFDAILTDVIEFIRNQ